MAELKPCPFCGSKPFHYFFCDGLNNYNSVTCNKCGVALTKKNIIGTESIEAWNRRAEDGKL